MTYTVYADQIISSIVHIRQFETAQIIDIGYMELRSRIS